MSLMMLERARKDDDEILSMLRQVSRFDVQNPHLLFEEDELVLFF